MKLLERIVAWFAQDEPDPDPPNSTQTLTDDEREALWAPLTQPKETND